MLNRYSGSLLSLAGTVLLPSSSLYASANKDVKLVEVHTFNDSAVVCRYNLARFSTAGIKSIPVVDSPYDTKGPASEAGVSRAHGAQDVTRAWQADESETPDILVEMTDECNSPATGDVIPFPVVEAVNDYFAIGFITKFDLLSIDVGTAGTIGVVVWEYWNGTAWTALTGVTDNTTGFTVLGVNTVDWTLPSDWDVTSLQGEDPLFYVRAKITTVYTINPILDEVDISGLTPGPTINEIIQGLVFRAEIGAGFILNFGKKGLIIPVGIENGIGLVLASGAGQAIQTKYVWEE